MDNNLPSYVDEAIKEIKSNHRNDGIQIKLIKPHTNKGIDISGDGQIGIIGSPLDAKLILQATDEEGNTIKGVHIYYKIISQPLKVIKFYSNFVRKRSKIEVERATGYYWENDYIDDKTGEILNRDVFLRRLVDSLYSRSEIKFERSNFRVEGDTVDVFLSFFPPCEQ